MGSNPQADWQAYLQTHNVAPDQRRAQLPTLLANFGKQSGYQTAATGVDHHGTGTGTDTGTINGTQYDLIHGGDNAWQFITDSGGSPQAAPSAGGGGVNLAALLARLHGPQATPSSPMPPQAAQALQLLAQRLQQPQAQPQAAQPSSPQIDLESMIAAAMAHATGA